MTTRPLDSGAPRRWMSTLRRPSAGRSWASSWYERTPQTMKRRPSATALRRTRHSSPPATTRSAPRATPAPLPSRDELLRLIRARNRRVESLRREDVIRSEPRLVRAADKLFGAWRHAVAAAGFIVPGNQRWDESSILGEILALHRQGAPLALARVPRALTEAAVMHFGTWRSAIERAGLDYDAIRLRRRKSRDEILALIRAGAGTGRMGIGPEGAISAGLADQAREEFGNLSAAIEAAGLDPGQVMVVRRYTDDQFAAELRKLARERPEMTLTEVGATSLGHHATKRFGSVRAAAAALEINDWPRQVHVALPSRDEVLVGVQQRHRSGASMRLTEVIHDDRRLMNGAYKHFGTWRSALRAAGIPFEEAFWGRPQVKAELRARRLRHEGISAAAIERDDPRLWSAVISCFGSLSLALREAGIKAPPT